MKLSKYLADYIEHEIPEEKLEGWVVQILARNEILTQIIQQGIEAFESTEQVRIRIIDERQQELATLIILAKEFIDWPQRKSFCNSGQHICDKLASYFEEILK